MNLFYFDTETYPIRPGRLAPPVVCLQAAADDGAPGIVTARDVIADVLPKVAEIPNAVFVGHSVAYDMAVLGANFPHLLPLIFKLYAENRVICTRVREKLIRIARGMEKFGGYSLAECCEWHKIDHGYNVDAKGNKAEAWRTNYAALEHVPLPQWPVDAKRYAKLDITNLRSLFERQGSKYPEAWFGDQYAQTRADFALHLMACWGFMTDAEEVDRFVSGVEAEHMEIRATLLAAGLVRADSTRNTKAAKDRMVAVRTAAGLEIPKTKKKQVSLDAEACKGSGDPLLVKYARFGSIKTLRSRGERLRMGVHVPLQPSYDVLKETGRTSCRQGDVKPGKPMSSVGIQVQNMSREPGMRECIIPRPGTLIAAVDWRGAELHTFGQACIDFGLDSRLANTLNEGRNAHDVLAAEIMQRPYQWTIEALDGQHGEAAKATAKNARQTSKPANFGYPGGMGHAAFREFAAAQYGVVLTEQQSRTLKAQWFNRTPEARPYFEIINRLVAKDKPVPLPRSWRYRGGASYCALCNYFFQGPAADMAKWAAFVIARECYTPGGVLFGCRPIAFIHDEFLVEVPEERAHECTMRIVQIMEDAGRAWCPDVPVKAEPSLMRRWYKAAEPVWKNGELQVWVPKSSAA